MKLREQRAEKVDAATALVDAAETEDRDLTDDEQTRLEGCKEEITALDTRIARQEELMEMDRAAPAAAGDPNSRQQQQGQRIGGVHDLREDDPKHGFASFGEFASAVRAASQPGMPADNRLNIGAGPTTYGNEGAGSDGGFLVPPEFSGRVREHALEEDAFLPLTDGDEIQGNSMTFPRDETTPWGSNGVRAYWEGEADQAAQTNPVLKSATLRLRRLTALVPVTDELLSDTSALSGYLDRKTGESIRWKSNDAIINGLGAGQPSGITQAACLVTQAKKASQAADTIVADNIVKMFARNTNPGRAVWLVNPDAYPQLPLMTIGDQPMFVGPMGLQSAPAGSLLGRPIIMTDACQTLGDLNDLLFVDFQGYKTITKAGGIETATSIHLWFDYNTTAFRATFRMDGQPWLGSAITPPNSAVTRSPFVTLAARA
ncbi:MAG: phage major capsid protein [bacterium]|nr:phage major capsid protein [bacterium]